MAGPSKKLRFDNTDMDMPPQGNAQADDIASLQLQINDLDSLVEENEKLVSDMNKKLKLCTSEMDELEEKKMERELVWIEESDAVETARADLKAQESDLQSKIDSLKISLERSTGRLGELQRELKDCHRHNDELMAILSMR